MGARIWFRKPLAILTLAIALLMTIAACSGNTSGDAADQLGVSTTDGSGTLGSTIALHGDWVIDIANADGTLASRHEFSNALSARGPWLIALVLATSRTPGSWRIVLGESQSTPYSPCLGSSANLLACVIVEPSAAPTLTAAALSTNHSANLIVTPTPIRSPTRCAQWGNSYEWQHHGGERCTAFSSSDNARNLHIGHSARRLRGTWGV